MYYAYWRSNPQLANGGYLTIRESKPKSKVSYGGMCYLGKIKETDFEREFPSGVQGLTVDDIKQFLK